MPTASYAIREEWGHNDEDDFGPMGAESKADKHLRMAGFRFSPREWGYTAPQGYVFSAKDRSALEYLVTEWDYSGFLGFHEANTDSPAP